MCFSATASFTVSAVLLVAGVASIKKVTKPSQFIFAGIPIVFSIQQFSEGFLWLALTDTAYLQWQKPAAYFFLAFAQAFWPVWVPLAFLLLEKDRMRIKIISTLLGMGAILSVYLAYCLFYYEVSFKISQHHIQYALFFPDDIKWLTRTFYFLPIILTPFISSVKKAWMLGGLNLASYLVSLLFFHDSIISVWCFFAAALSAVVLAMMGPLSKNKT